MGSSIGVCKLCPRQAKLIACPKCKQKVCQKCFDYPVLNVPQNPTLKNVQYVACCKNCFVELTELDFKRKYDIYGDENTKQIVLIHGAGSCRKMFEPHAVELAKKGYRCILMDLPGHGSRMDQALNAQTCIESIRQTIKVTCKTNDVTLIGGSLGGYVLMQVLGRDSTLCKRAVVMMSGQDVGVKRGKLASLGLWFINKSVTMMSRVRLANSFLSSSASNQYLIPQYVMSILKSGSFFMHGQENVLLLKSLDYEQSLKKTEKKIKFLFINGEKDFRDSQQIWLAAAGQQSRLIVYEKGDHFFSHDNRFFQKLIQDINQFVEE